MRLCRRRSHCFALAFTSAAKHELLHFRNAILRSILNNLATTLWVVLPPNRLFMVSVIGLFTLILKGRSMSSFLQRKQKSRQPTTPEPTSPTHTPQQWLSPAFNQSVPNFAKLPHPHRSLGFSSIRQLARSSRQGPSRPEGHRLRSSSSLYGTLRDQCTPPILESIAKASPNSSELELHIRHDSSADSFTPDQSGVSAGSSDLTTPSPGKSHALLQLNTSSPPQPDDMGQKTSTLTRKPLSLKAKQSLATVRGDQERERSSPEPDLSPQPPSATKPPPAKSSLKVQVPRRRSSLTAIHLDSSHFDTLDPKHPNLQHRASTLTEPARRPSGLSESIVPIISNTSRLEIKAQLHGTLSPPLLSPPISATRVSSISSNSPSDNQRTSPVSSHIHLPKTFPKGPVPIPAPTLTIVHKHCYQGHRRMIPSSNKYSPVPCMVCRQEEYDKRYRCPFCALRVCEPCLAEFDRRGRDLEQTVTWMAKLKEDAKAAEWLDEKGSATGPKNGGVECDWKENAGKQTPEPDRVRKKKMRETM